MRNIYEATVQAGNLTTWTALIEVIGLVDLLRSDEYLTVLAPSDHAFEKLSRREVNDLLASLERLVCTAGNHLIAGRILTREIQSLTSLRSFVKNELFIEAGEHLIIAGARVIESDIGCRNGLIHIVDSVLLSRTRRKSRVYMESVQVANWRTGD